MNQRLFKFLRKNCFTQYKNFGKYKILQCLCAKFKRLITVIFIVIIENNVNLLSLNSIPMTILDLFSSGFNTRNQDHFAAIVKVAMSDNIISDEEKHFLDRLAQNLDISKEMYARILKDYKSHPINPPTNLEKRIERLYDLTRMVNVDTIKFPQKVRLLTKLTIGLGFESDAVSKVVSVALNRVSKGDEYDVFKEQIRYLGSPR
tara:strand:- start:1956 stop:2567 length:612 start_codon:yes stop_codon:yes gene_type:complete